MENQLLGKINGFVNSEETPEDLKNLLQEFLVWHNGEQDKDGKIMLFQKSLHMFFKYVFINTKYAYILHDIKDYTSNI